MTQEKKELLLKDLCARLPYGIKAVGFSESKTEGEIISLCEIVKDGTAEYANCFIDSEGAWWNIKSIKPYLRPMSSMTEEERIEFSKLLVKRYCEEDWEGHISTSYCIEIDNVYTDDEDGIKYPSTFLMDAIDWLNKHHFDYRGLIPLGLAIEVTEENNPYKD